MTKTGAFTFVLHSHLPYARQAGMWPHGEEWVHEAIAETYVPLLNALYDLEAEEVPFNLTIGITPILGEQLADPLIVDHFVAYASERAAWAAADIDRFAADGDEAMRELALFYHHWYGRVLASFQDRFSRDILGAFKGLQDRGRIEIATCAATHGYLPLMSRDSTIYAQVKTGADAYKARFGRDPKAIWLPECAYRPAIIEQSDQGDIRRPGIESFLAERGIRVFFSETHTVEGGRPVGKAMGDAVGLYGNVPRRYAVPLTPEEQSQPGTTFQAYWVGDAPGQVAVLGRNNRTGMQVWSGEHGYPGDFAYREFHRKDATSGLQYWRIGGRTVDLGDKPPYDPAIASGKTAEHASHFSNLVEEQLATYHAENGKVGVISAAFDTELFGHWWFEGVDWLKHVLRNLAASETVQLTTASRIIDEQEPERVMVLPESSWGSGGSHFTWLNDDTEWMWGPLHVAESRMEALVASHPDATGDTADLLNQTARELLLAESSDWPFLVTTGQATEYATLRFNEHLERFNQLADLAEAGGSLDDAGQALLDGLKERDNPFPGIDYRVFAARQGSAADAVTS